MQSKNSVFTGMFKKVSTIHCLLFFILSTFAITTTAQNGKERIGKCFLNNDFVGLIPYFDPNIKLEILKNEEILSKKEAASKLENFFSTPIKSFKLIHEGGSDNKLKFFIASIGVSNENYRTYFLYREAAGKVYISEVRIEAEE